MLDEELAEGKRFTPTRCTFELPGSATLRIRIARIGQPYDRSLVDFDKLDSYGDVDVGADGMPTELEQVGPTSLDDGTAVLPRVVIGSPVFPPKVDAAARSRIDLGAIGKPCVQIRGSRECVIYAADVGANQYGRREVLSNDGTHQGNVSSAECTAGAIRLNGIVLQ